MKFYPTFINAGNPQLVLLANFLAVCASTNEEATFRVFKKLTIECEAPNEYRRGCIRVVGPTGQTDIIIEAGAMIGDNQYVTPGRLAMLRAVFEAVECRSGLVPAPWRPSEEL